MSDSFWEATYRQNIGRMIGVCCRYTQNRQIAEDLAHDAFLVAIDKASSFENKGPFEAWLRRIAVNVALQYLRQQKRKEKWEERAIYDAIGDDMSYESHVNDERSFSEAELLEMIQNLPEHHKLVFNLYVIDNFTHAQISFSLGISEGTSKSHLARARKKLRELLDENLGNERRRKRTLIWLMFSYQIRPVDLLFTERLKAFSILPKKPFSFSLSVPGTFTPGIKTSGISYVSYLKTGIVTITAALFLTGDPTATIYKGTKDIFPVKYRVSDSTHRKFSGPTAATNPENRIIVEKRKQSEPMKNLSTLTGIIVTSLALDTAGLSTKLPSAFENHRTIISPSLGTIAKPESDGMGGKRNPNLVSGSFYASKLLWSAEDGRLFVSGNHVKVDLNTNKFTGSGKFSFLNKVNYLVIDGVPVAQNQTIKLQDKKYNLVSLDGLEGARKYGDNARSGVVEITLAE